LGEQNSETGQQLLRQAESHCRGSFGVRELLFRFGKREFKQR
jgi:hypothetical protein